MAAGRHVSTGAGEGAQLARLGGGMGAVHAATLLLLLLLLQGLWQSGAKPVLGGSP